MKNLAVHSKASFSASLFLAFFVFLSGYIADWSKLDPEHGFNCILYFDSDGPNGVQGNGTSEDESIGNLPRFVRALAMGFSTWDDLHYGGYSRFQDYSFVVSGALSKIEFAQKYPILTWRLIGAARLLLFSLVVALTIAWAQFSRIQALSYIAFLLLWGQHITNAALLWSWFTLLPVTAIAYWTAQSNNFLRHKKIRTGFALALVSLVAFLVAQSGHLLYAALSNFAALIFFFCFLKEKNRRAFFLGTCALVLGNILAFPILYYQVFEAIRSYRSLLSKSFRVTIDSLLVPNFDFNGDYTLIPHQFLDQAAPTLSKVLKGLVGYGRGYLAPLLWFFALVGYWKERARFRFTSWVFVGPALILIPLSTILSALFSLGIPVPKLLSSFYWGYYFTAAVPIVCFEVARHLPLLLKTLSESARSTLNRLLILLCFLACYELSRNNFSAYFNGTSLALVLFALFSIRKRKTSYVPQLTLFAMAIVLVAPCLKMARALSETKGAIFSFGYFDRKLSFAKQAILDPSGNRAYSSWSSVPEDLPFDAQPVSENHPSTGHLTFQTACPHLVEKRVPLPGISGPALGISFLDGVSETFDRDIYLASARLCFPNSGMQVEFWDLLPYRYKQCVNTTNLAKFYDATSYWSPRCNFDLKKNWETRETAPIVNCPQKTSSGEATYPTLVEASKSIRFYPSAFDLLQDLPKLVRLENDIAALAPDASVIAADRQLRLVPKSRSGLEKIFYRIEDSTVSPETIARLGLELGAGQMRLAQQSNGFRQWKASCGSKACLFVLKENFDPRWKAKIDGEPTRFFRANANQIGILVPGREHQIELKWNPKLIL